ncbi:hypothetical protein CVT25_014714 [Psilocybe cyanescens]|uniref:Uncharacterized protein n=1 Tax=Psilocybe cyanescens TaxID=93625 RepID=A0A409XK32_PSICY|nr:hypothetical protein CVT25_014714 [Psilocybe cyanescens]
MEYRIPIFPATRSVLRHDGHDGQVRCLMYHDEELDGADEDSDVLDDLRCILAAERVDTEEERAKQEWERGREETRAILTTTRTWRWKLRPQICDNDTTKSSNFTGKSTQLNESGGSDRRSFVEQLENAFRTPAKVGLWYDLGVDLGIGVSSVPALPGHLDVVGGESDDSGCVQEVEEEEEEGEGEGTRRSGSAGFRTPSRRCRLLPYRRQSPWILRNRHRPAESATRLHNK